MDVNKVDGRGGRAEDGEDGDGDVTAEFDAFKIEVKWGGNGVDCCKEGLEGGWGV